ncbi:MAG: hypothetical protein ACXVA9_08095 [Bdellovibrionales bacterium]
METRDYSPSKKALQVNLDDSIYGTFAEIGAGQEVARHFFQAGRASHTIAKTISAYDMTFSDEIYGKESRYVCEARLLKMLDKEFGLLQSRLKEQRGDTSRFFAFADTVSTSSSDDGVSKSHGWMGIRFQSKPGGPANDIILHLKLWDRFRLPQQEALGILGVNLIHMAFFPPADPAARITQLIDSLSTKRIEVNMLRFSGPDLAHLNNRLLSLELVKQHLTDAVLFAPNGEVLHAGDALFRQPILVQRGTYRPVTNSNVAILDKVVAQFEKHPLVKGANPRVLFEITINSLSANAGTGIDDEDFLHRVDTLAALGHEVLLSNFQLFYQMKSFLRQCSAEALGIVIGASLLPKMFNEDYYKHLPGGILEGMSRLFDDNTRVFVFPDKTSTTCSTAGTFNPDPKLQFLYKHLLANHWIEDVLNCDEVDASIHSEDVRKMLMAGDPKWKKLVPERARKIIEERQLFGYRP